jgi:hypothetical protein
MLLCGGLRYLACDDGSGSCGSCSGYACVGDRDDRGGWTAAWFVLVIDDLLERAVFEEDVLACVQLVAGLAELVGDAERTGVAVAGYAQAKVERTCALEGEAKVGRQDDVAGGCAGCDLDSSAIEGEHEGSVDGAFTGIEVKSAGSADADASTAIECDFGGVVTRGDG